MNEQRQFSNEPLQLLKLPEYKAELIVGENLHICITKRMNWFHRLMFKVFFGITVKNYPKEKGNE